MAFKNNILSISILALASNLLLSCGSNLAVYKVSNYTESTISEKYDSDAKLGYTISKDETNLYVKLSTLDTPNQIKILNNGITIYFDSEGKKEEHTFVHFPMTKESRSRPDFEALKNDKKSFIGTQISTLSDDIQISINGKVTQINKKLNSENISVSIDTDGEELVYQLKLPLSKLTFVEGQLPSLGISIEGIQRPSSAQGNPSGGRPAGVGGGRPSGTGGGRPAGVGGGRPGGGGRPSGSTTQQSPFASLSSDIDIWLLLEINPKS